MIIDCISDLHGHYPSLPGGDLLIVAGDLTRKDTRDEHLDFLCWMVKQRYKKTVWIAGNHDNMYLGEQSLQEKTEGVEYLCDAGTEFEGMKIWGSPWTLSFPGMNPKCKAFCLESEDEIKEKFDLIPHGTDILLTHMPPYGIMDQIWESRHSHYQKVGSTSLANRIEVVKPKLVVFGHIHEGYGKEGEGATMYVNASHVNEYYEPINAPIRIEL